MIEIKNINVSYNQQIVFKDSQIIIPDGQLTAINGKSGSGKTTLFYIIGLYHVLKGMNILTMVEILILLMIILSLHYVSQKLVLYFKIRIYMNI